MKPVSNTRTKKASAKPKPGPCSTPKCEGKRTEGRRFCRSCAENLDRIREELATDPNLLFHQRSDSSHRVFSDDRPGKKKRLPKAPTCCMPGCYEPRMPPLAFCDAHRDQGEEEDVA